ncbi:MAG TPA: hypothetical protein VFL98_00685 [Candidatus Paceibacterota bacterium]|nr:hypothetical protein [Candidatus Paceibacterota bacterium]
MDFGIFSVVPMDFLIFFIAWVVLSVVALQGGRGEVLSMMLGAFVGVAVFDYAQKAFWLSGIIAPYVAVPRDAAIGLAILIILSYLVIRMLMLPYGSDLIGSPSQSAVIGFLCTAIIFSIWVAAPSTDAIWHFGSLFQTIFSPMYAFWWIVGSFGLLALFG